jgi:hypothetical protein
MRLDSIEGAVQAPSRRNRLHAPRPAAFGAPRGQVAAAPRVRATTGGSAARSFRATQIGKAVEIKQIAKYIVTFGRFRADFLDWHVVDYLLENFGQRRAPI